MPTENLSLEIQDERLALDHIAQLEDRGWRNIEAVRAPRILSEGGHYVMVTRITAAKGDP